MKCPHPPVTVRLTFTDPVNGPARAVAALITPPAPPAPVERPQAPRQG